MKRALILLVVVAAFCCSEEVRAEMSFVKSKYENIYFFVHRVDINEASFRNCTISKEVKSPKKVTFSKWTGCNDKSSTSNNFAYRIENHELSSDIFANQNSAIKAKFLYVTPGLDYNGHDPFGFLACPEDLTTRDEMDCLYYSFTNDKPVSYYTSGIQELSVSYKIGKVSYTYLLEDKLACCAKYKDRYKKAVVINMTDRNTSYGTDDSYTEDERFMINTIYSVLRALELSYELSKSFKTETYVYSDLFTTAASDNRDAGDKERSSIVYFYNGKFPSKAVIEKAAMALQSKITSDFINYCQTKASSSTNKIVQKIGSAKFKVACDIIKQLKWAGTVYSLEDVLKKKDLSEKYKEAFQDKKTCSASLSVRQ